MGRHDDAMRWYEHIAETSIFELVYLPIARFRLAQMYEARGDDVRARESYERFVDLWESADSALQPRVDEARAAIQRLSGSSS